MFNRNIPKTLDDVIIIDDSKPNKLTVKINNVTIPYLKILRDMMFDHVPTMAIDKILIYNNTSTRNFEEIANDLELIPIYANPNDFKYFDGAHTGDNTIVFDLDKTGPTMQETLSNPYSTYLLSGNLKWVPFEQVAFHLNPDLDLDTYGDQQNKFNNDPPRVSDDNFVILALRQGENVKMRCLALKGSGKYHTKFSPVSNVIYEKIGQNDQIIEGTSMDPITLKQPQPTYKPNLALLNYIERRTITGDVTVTEYSLLYPEQNYTLTLETKGQLSPLDVLKEAIKLTVSYMEKPLSERQEDITIPGYVY